MKGKVKLTLTLGEYNAFKHFEIQQRLTGILQSGEKRPYIIAVLENGSTESEYLTANQARTIYSKFKVATTEKEAAKIRKFVAEKNNKKKW